jgi:hypothetical protein
MTIAAGPYHRTVEPRDGAACHGAACPVLLVDAKPSRGRTVRDAIVRRGFPWESAPPRSLAAASIASMASSVSLRKFATTLLLTYEAQRPPGTTSLVGRGNVRAQSGAGPRPTSRQTEALDSDQIRKQIARLESLLAQKATERSRVVGIFRAGD